MVEYLKYRQSTKKDFLTFHDCAYVKTKQEKFIQYIASYESRCMANARRDLRAGNFSTTIGLRRI